MQPGASVMTEIRSELATRYVRPLPGDVMSEDSVTALLARLHDPYTTYLTPAEYESVRAGVASDEIGVGLRVAPGRGVLRVLGAVDGSPAARLGVRPGDAIVAIDGVPTHGLRFDDALARLKGVSGTALRLRIVHGPDS